MSRRLNPFAQYLITLGLMIGAYFVYLAVAVPLIEGPGTLVRGPRGEVGVYQPPDYLAGLRYLFPEDAWELETCKTVKTPQGMILCKDYQPSEEGQIEVFPFTMILSPKDPKGVPTVIRCLQRAKVMFDGPLSLDGGGGGDDGQMSHVEKAELVGRVVIFRPPTTPGGDDGLRIETSNVQIDKHQAFTPDKVEFDLGKHSGQGSQLRIELSQKGGGENRLTSSFSTVGGVKSIRLAKLDYLNLHPGKKKSAGAEETDRLFSGGDEPVVVTCAAAFEFDLVRNEASFAKQVWVRQGKEGGDSLVCDELRIRFEGQSLTQVDPTKPGVGNNLRLDQILAIGSPVVLDIRSKELKVVGQQLRYSNSNGEVYAKSEQGLVTIENKSFFFESPEITYRSNKDQSMGDLDAAGPGRVIRRGAGNSGTSGTFSSAWNGVLDIRTDGDKKRITMTGGTEIAFQSDTRFAAEQVKFWLWPVKETPQPKLPGDDSTPTGKWSYLPARLEAVGNVQIVSPELVGTARRLSALWPAVGVVPQRPQSTNGLSLSTVTGLNQLAGVRRHLVRRPRQDADRAMIGNAPQAASTFPTTNSGFIKALPRGANQIFAPRAFTGQKPKTKFKFDGDAVVVGFADHSSNPTIRDLRIDGNVTIIELAPEKPKPLKIEGSRLDMTPQGKDLYRFFIGGDTKQLASIESESLNLSGINIHLDQAANKLWVQGVGRMNLLSPAKEKALGQQSDTVQIDWQGGMIFDGKHIYFEKDVLLDASQTVNGKADGKMGQPMATADVARRLTRTRSNVLNVTVIRRIDFSELTRSRNRDANGGSDQQGASIQMTEAEIKEIVLIDRMEPDRRVFKLASHSQTAEPSYVPVVVELQSFDAAGQLIEKQRFVAPSVRILPPRGYVSAKGPGLISTHRKGQQLGKSPGFAPSPGAATPMALTFLRVNFDSGIEASEESAKLKIIGNVRAAFVPTNDWNLSLDPDQLFQVPMGGGKLVCEQVEIEKWQARSVSEPTIEFIATGNVHMWGDLFEATAERVSYNDTDDMLIVEGSPRSYAQLWHQKTPQSGRTNLVAGKIWYRPSDQQTRVERIKNASTTLEKKRKGGRQ